MAHRRQLLTIVSVLVVSLLVTCAPTRPPATPAAVPSATATPVAAATATLAPTATATSAPTATIAPTFPPPSPTPLSHVTLLGHIGGRGSAFVPVDESEYNEPGQALSVAVAGGYAYVAQGADGPVSTTWGNLCVVDVSNPVLPKVAGSFVPNLAGTDVVVADSTAYLTDGRCYFGQGACHGALYTLDVTNPTTPVRLGVYQFEGMRAEMLWFRSWYASSVAVAGRYAFVTGGAYYARPGDEYGLCILDISQPAAPAKVGVLHGGQDDPVWAGVRLDVVGGYAYVAAMDDGLRVVDVSDPAAPREVYLADMPGQARDVVVAGRYAYVAADTEGLRVLDISDPTRPSELGSCSTPKGAESVAVAGQYAYVAATEAGLRVIDISDPAHPVEVGYYDTPGYAVDVAVAGDDVYVADIIEGLFILRFQP